MLLNRFLLQVCTLHLELVLIAEKLEFYYRRRCGIDGSSWYTCSGMQERIFQLSLQFVFVTFHVRYFAQSRNKQQGMEGEE